MQETGCSHRAIRVVLLAQTLHVLLICINKNVFTSLVFLYQSLTTDRAEEPI